MTTLHLIVHKSVLEEGLKSEDGGAFSFGREAALRIPEVLTRIKEVELTEGHIKHLRDDLYYAQRRH